LFFLTIATTAAQLSAGPLSVEPEKVRVEFDPHLESTEAVVHLENPTSEEVAIHGVQTCCDCVSAVEPPRRVGRGGRVALRLHIKPGTLTGKIERVATVQTGDGLVLVPLEIVVPEVARMEPERLVWKQGEEAAAKVVVLRTAAADWPVKRVRTTNRRFAVRTEVKPKAIEIAVTPSETEQAGSSQLIIETENLYPAWHRVVVPLEIVPINSPAK